MNTNSPEQGEPRHTNRLAREKSPYLLQHAHNPVDWYPWGDEAFTRARTEEKPIFLSIGYSTCHWCHVMERESFESEAVALLLNSHFISIKLDREERPDIDKIYMTFVQSTTGGGGWPLNVFLTPDLKPFYGGTYWPPEAKYGRASFSQVLERVAELWKTQRTDLERSAEEMTAQLRSMATYDAHNAFPAGERELHGAGQTFLHEYDSLHGGFGTAPKFPRPSQPIYLLRYGKRFGDLDALRAVRHTCEAMAAGGLQDQLGGGFSRYSVDEGWRVPHFEKMLYDQAQLVNLYLDTYLATGEPSLAKVVRNTIGYVSRDLKHPDGGFFSAEDADSEGKEGKFYCWNQAEFQSLLTTEECAVVTRYYGITEKGNFLDHSDPEPLLGQNVLSVVDSNLSDTERACLESAQEKLLQARAHRVRPHRDDKILTSWNGMMLGAVARASVLLDAPEFREMAEQNLAFLQHHLWDPASQSLFSRWCEGERDQVQLLDAYANLLQGVIDLYEATVDPRHLEFAVSLAEAMVARFYDAESGGFWQTLADAPHLLLRHKEDYDGAEPSGNSVATLALLRLAAICGRPDWREAAEKSIRLMAQRLHQFPQSVPHLLLALDFAIQEPRRVVLAGDFSCGSTHALLVAAHGVFQPHRVILGNSGPVDPFARGLPVHEEFTQAFCCSGTACQAPTRDREQVHHFLMANEPE